MRFIIDNNGEFLSTVYILYTIRQYARQIYFTISIFNEALQSPDIRFDEFINVFSNNDIIDIESVVLS